jgi:hypothetical protein
MMNINELMNININKKWLQYVLFFSLFIVSQSLSMWGQYVTLPFKNLSMWEAYKMAIPFAWLSWLIMTFTITIGHKYNLVTPTQDIFLLIIIQFSLILIINQVYLKQPITKSDIIAFIFILFGFFVSFFHLTTRFLGISPNNEKMHTNTNKNVEEIEDVV